jgi:endonuclease/exonuclease/phosphatase (EEP) superfamily protein YafD
MTRLPVAEHGVLHHDGMDLPAITVLIGDRRVLVLAVHTTAPHARGAVGTWMRQFEAVADAASWEDEVVAIGDFNAAPWNGPFRRLLDRGFVDAHDALGHGLSRTWGPRHFGLDGAVRLLGIDHSVSRGDLVPLSVVDVDVPGSDHRGVAVTYAVR